MCNIIDAKEKQLAGKNDAKDASTYKLRIEYRCFIPA